MTWWQVYQDEFLQALVREAFTNNYDLRIAAARVEQARAIAMQARSQFVPSATYGGTVSRGRNELFGSAFSNWRSDSQFGCGDAECILGSGPVGPRSPSQRICARAIIWPSEEARRGVRLSLLSEVATAYFQLLELDQEMEIASRTTNSFGGELEEFSPSAWKAGRRRHWNRRAPKRLSTMRRRALPAIRQRIAVTENELSVLLGRNPGPIPRPSLIAATEAPPEIPGRLPSALLERRPDIRETEQLLRSANAQVGESVAEFFPKIGLTAFFGKVSPELSAFTLGGANAWGIAAEGTGPLFQGGRLVGQYRQAKASRDEATLRYRQTVLNAFREVSDALGRARTTGGSSRTEAHQVERAGTGGASFPPSDTSPAKPAITRFSKRNNNSSRPS